MRHLVTPSNIQDAMKTAYMKLLQGPDVAALSYPGFTAVEEDGDADCLVDTDFCVQINVFVLKDPVPQPPKGKFMSTTCSVWTAESSALPVEPSATAV